MLNNELNIYFALVLFFFSAARAFGCSDPPSGYFLEPEEMVEEASSIVFAEALSVKNNDSRPDLRLVEFRKLLVLKGKVKNIFYLPALEESSEYGDFNLHNDKQFWNYAMTGNGVPTGDCNAYATFVIGNKYLILFGLNHTKAYEQIDNMEKDMWYKFVKKHLESRK